MPSVRRPLWLASILVMAGILLLAACGGGEKATPTPGAGTPAPGGTPAAGVATPSGGKLVIVGTEQGGRNLFIPDKAQIPVGTEITVEFQNKGQAIHDMFIQGTNFRSDQVVQGGKNSSFKVKIDRAGSFKFICEYHQPEMAGTLEVK
ncbi:MAG TPA: cupredoxin domain-containing protein [Dehalococcoidia bacterium]|nr:cupredoxin domain-containing protein [Dehalococcoidia bacterium]